MSTFDDLNVSICYTKDSFAACLSHFEQSNASFLLFFLFVSSYVSILLDSQQEVSFGKASFLDRTESMQKRHLFDKREVSFQKRDVFFFKGDIF